jgi:hypothetical protein
MNRMPKFVRIAHETEGRTRLRLSWLREEPDTAGDLADHLAALDGIVEVQVRPYTGSVLCTYDATRLNTARIVAAVRDHTGVERVLGPRDRAPYARPTFLGPKHTERGSVARAVAESFREINLDVLEATEGRLDLGTMAAFAALAAGAIEVVATRQMSPPPWFNLAWWAIRTFTTFEADVLDEIESVHSEAGA